MVLESAGAVVGVGLMWAVNGAVARSGLCDRIVRWQERHSRRFYAVAFLLTFELAPLFESTINRVFHDDA